MWVTAKSTSMPIAVTTPCLTRRESGSLKMPEKPIQALCPTSSCSAADLRNGRLDSNCDNVFIRHLHPYGGFQSSAAVSSALKKYITYAGLTRKNRKAIHSLRRTLASTLLMDGTPLLTISNILGHSSPKTTTGYTKVNLPALRKCALSYGKWEASA